MALKIRAQLRPADTNTHSLYSMGTLAEGAYEQEPLGDGIIRIVNTSAGFATYRIFQHLVGQTFDQSTAHSYDVSIGAGAAHVLSAAAISRPGQSLGVRSSVASALTFTFEAEDP